MRSGSKMSWDQHWPLLLVCWRTACWQPALCGSDVGRSWWADWLAADPKQRLHCPRADVQPTRPRPHPCPDFLSEALTAAMCTTALSETDETSTWEKKKQSGVLSLMKLDSFQAHILSLLSQIIIMKKTNTLNQLFKKNPYVLNMQMKNTSPFSDEMVLHRIYLHIDPDRLKYIMM